MPKGLLRYRNDGNFASPARRELAAKPEDWPWATSGTGDASFTGQNSDTVSSLYDFTFRRFSPSQGRWISPDPAGLAAVDPANPQTWNRYAYVANNPLSFIDPLGLQVMGPPGTPGGPNGGPNGDPNNPFDPSGSGSVWSGAISGVLTYQIDYYALIYQGVNPDQSFAYLVVPVWKLSDMSFFGSSTYGGIGGWSGGQAVGSQAPNNGLPTPTKHKATIPGTNYCGPGGNGTPTDQVDAACAAHDACYQNAGVSWRNNVPFGPSMNAAQGAAIQGCDSNLCSTLNNMSWPTSAEMGQATLVETYFNCSGGGYNLR